MKSIFAGIGIFQHLNLLLVRFIPNQFMLSKPQNAYLYKTALSRRLLCFKTSKAMKHIQRCRMESFFMKVLHWIWRLLHRMTPSFSNPCTQTRHHFLSGNKGQILCLFDISYPHSSHSSCLLKALIIILLIIAKRLVASRRHGSKISGSQQPGNNMVT